MARNIMPTGYRIDSIPRRVVCLICSSVAAKTLDEHPTAPGAGAATAKPA